MKIVKIFTAGPMEPEVIRTKVAGWRMQLEKAVSFPDKPLKIEWLHPELISDGQTKGIDPNQTVEGNYNLVKSTDIVVAYMDRVDQHGTMVEIYWSRQLNKKLIYFVSEELFTTKSAYPAMKHGCCCLLPGLGKSAYWYFETALNLRPISVKPKDTVKMASIIGTVLESWGSPPVA